jgi:hypothetical protein
VTYRLAELANHSVVAYAALTLLAGAVLVGVSVVLGRGQTLHAKRLAAVIAEGAVYAVGMKMVASCVVGSLRLSACDGQIGLLAGLVMSLGAGFYEEVAFRVVFFGLGLKLLTRLVRNNGPGLVLTWAVATAFVFSAWHYVGPFADPFRLGSFVFRWVCGLVFVAIYRWRGFAPAVWCHALYDIWVLAL